MSEAVVEEGVPPEEAQAEAAELPARLGSFHELCTRLGIAGVEEALATELQVTNEQQLIMLAELGLPEMDCQEIGIDFTQRKAILDWATQEKRRKHDERLVSAATRGPIHTPEELAETEQIERKAREGRSLAASGFPWVDTKGEIQPKVTLWSYLYKEEAARIEAVAPRLQWMWQDASLMGNYEPLTPVGDLLKSGAQKAAKANPFRWESGTPQEVIAQLTEGTSKSDKERIESGHPVLLRAIPDDEGSNTFWRPLLASKGTVQDGGESKFKNAEKARNFIDAARKSRAGRCPRKCASEPEESGPESEPEPEPEQEPAPDGGSSSGDSGLRSWEAPNNAAMDEALAAAEAKKLADDLEPSDLEQAAALMAARSGRPTPAPGEATGPDGEAPAPAALYGAPQEPAAGKESGALDQAEAVVMETTGADSTSPEADGPTVGGGALQMAPPHVPSGRFGEGDWFCDARLRRCTSSKESWAEFRKLVPDEMKAVQPLIEAWLTRKAEAKQAAAKEAETKKEAVKAWLREAGINEKAEEMLREYIGEGGGLEDISTLEEEDKLELARDLSPFYRPGDAVAMAAMGHSMETDAIKAVQAAIAVLKAPDEQGTGHN